MEEKEVLKAIKDLAKMMNESAKELGLTAAIKIPPKSTVEEAEAIMDDVIAGIQVQPSDEIVAAVESINEMIGEYKSNKGEDASDDSDDDEPPMPDEPPANLKSSPKEDLNPESEKEPEVTKEPTPETKNKTAPRKAPEKKTTPAPVDDQSPVIKKLYSLLNEEQIDQLDPSTMRAILKALK